MSRLSFSRVALAACAFLAVLLSASVAASAAPAQSPPQRELRSLSAAIEEVRRGPFHGPARGDSGGGAWIADRRESSAHPPRGPARHFGAERETPRGDSVSGLSAGKVFLGTVATSIPAYPVAQAFLLEGAYWRGGKSTGALVMLGGAIVGVVGPAIGARLAGGRFLGARGDHDAVRGEGRAVCGRRAVSAGRVDGPTAAGHRWASRSPTSLRQMISSNDSVGLCLRCASMRRVTNRRGSTFYLCGRHAEDLGFRKYPRLPVVECRGFEPGPSDRAASGPPTGPGGDA